MTINLLQNRYISALDSADMAAWLTCFKNEEKSSYICISSENVRNGYSIALMHDDCYSRLKDRVIFVDKIWSGTFQPYKTRHFVHQTSIKEINSKTIQVISNFSIISTVDPKPSSQLVAGEYVDIIDIGDDGELLFSSKTAVYDSDVLPKYIVYPF
mgnify:CR=1 FL=1